MYFLVAKVWRISGEPDQVGSRGAIVTPCGLSSVRFSAELHSAHRIDGSQKLLQSNINRLIDAREVIGTTGNGVRMRSTRYRVMSRLNLRLARNFSPSLPYDFTWVLERDFST